MSEKKHRRAKKPSLGALDMSLRLGRERYERKLAKVQRELQIIQQAYLATGDSAAIVFEGWDAAGKGGAIRRMAAVLDPRGFKVFPIAAPREYFKERHYLTRFWERLPPQGGIAVFDRSWYGRVMVERVEGFASEAEWKRAYREINEFEQTLIDHGTRIVKFFLHIDQEVQLARFEERLRNPMKRWKLTYDDFRNRDKWNEYEQAVSEMLEKTSTPKAPWHVVPANDKKYARIACLETIARQLARGVDLSPKPVGPKLREAACDHFDLEPEVIGSLVGSNE